MSHQSMSPKARSAENGGKQNPAFCATATKYYQTLSSGGHEMNIHIQKSDDCKKKYNGPIILAVLMLCANSDVATVRYHFIPALRVRVPAGVFYSMIGHHSDKSSTSVQAQEEKSKPEAKKQFFFFVWGFPQSHLYLYNL